MMFCILMLVVKKLSSVNLVQVLINCQIQFLFPEQRFIDNQGWDKGVKLKDQQGRNLIKVRVHDLKCLN